MNATDLPLDYSSVSPAATLSETDFKAADRVLVCEEIVAERVDLAAKISAAEAAIKSDRGRNQVAGYLGALFLIPLVAIDTNSEQVALLKHSRARIDTLRALALFRGCS